MQHDPTSLSQKKKRVPNFKSRIIFSFWQLISSSWSRTCIFLKKLWGIWEIANLSILPLHQQRERKRSQVIHWERGSWSLAGRWEQNKWLQGNLLPEKLIYTWVTRVYSFQEAFCFAFQTASFLPSNSVQVSLWELLRTWRFNSFPFATPWLSSAAKLAVPCHRTPFCPILCASLWFHWHREQLKHTPSGTISPHFHCCHYDRKANFKVLFLPTLSLYLFICFLILYVYLFCFFYFFYLFMPISPAPDSLLKILSTSFIILLQCSLYIKMQKHVTELHQVWRSYMT